MTPGNSLGAQFAGVRVLDLSRYLAGPQTTRILTQFGADVIRVEPPGGDPARRLPGNVLALHRDQRSIVLDFKVAEAREVLFDLARHADVLVENFRPGATAAWGIDHATMREVNPRLIYCSITGYGSSGPLSNLQATDGPMQAYSGLLDLMGAESGQLVPFFVADVAGGVYAAHAVLAALFARERSGEGCHLDISMLESVIQFLPRHAQVVLEGEPTVNARSPASRLLTLVLPAAGGKAVLVQLAQPAFDDRFRALMQSVPAGEGLRDERFATPQARADNADDYLALVRAAFAQRDRRHWLDELARAQIPAAEVNTLADALASPQLEHRGYLHTVDVPGRGLVPTVGNPFRVDGTPPRTDDGPGADLGQDTHQVLRDVLGYGDDTIARLTAAGALGNA